MILWANATIFGNGFEETTEPQMYAYSGLVVQVLIASVIASLSVPGTVFNFAP